MPLQARHPHRTLHPLRPNPVECGGRAERRHRFGSRGVRRVFRGDRTKSTITATTLPVDDNRLSKDRFAGLLLARRPLHRPAGQWAAAAVCCRRLMSSNAPGSVRLPLLAK
jgi:hypothetical protein